MKRWLYQFVRLMVPVLLLAPLLAGCGINDASVVNQNMTQDADNFKINRRVVFYNGITGEYILEVRGACSLGNATTGHKSVYVLCKKDSTTYVKHMLGVSDNVTWFAEQLDASVASASQYKVTFKPSVIIPAIELR